MDFWCSPFLCVVLSMSDLTFLLQKSGDFVVLAGLNAENEILHTLAFLAGVMFWSQVGLDFSISLLKNIPTLICIFVLHPA